MFANFQVDQHFTKYPRLPVLSCSEYEEDEKSVWCCLHAIRVVAMYLSPQRGKIKVLSSPYCQEVTMPYYIFYCLTCTKEFTQVLHVSELEKGGIKCPHCGSEKVEQNVAAFSAVTSKKS